MTFDPMAAAVDWLDAYRANDLEAVLKMYADDATVECACGGTKIISGKQGLRAYWLQRMKEFPASDLDDVQPSTEGATISYLTKGGLVKALLTFDAAGRITTSICAPETAQGSRLSS